MPDTNCRKRNIPLNSLALFFLSLLVITIVVMCTRPIIDGDIWFHLLYGKYIVGHHTLILDHQIFTWTPAGNETPYCQWIAQIVLYFCHQIGGLPLLFALRYAVFFFYLFLLVIYIRNHNLARRPLAWFIALLSLIILLTAINIKPNLFSCLLMPVIVFVWYHLKTLPSKKYYFCYIIPFLMLAWVNTHGVWMFGFAFLLSVCAGEVMNRFFSRAQALDPVVGRHFFIASILSGLVTVINPYGWRYPLHVWSEAGMQSHFAAAVFECFSLFGLMDKGVLAGYNYFAYFLISLVIIGALIRPQIKSRALDWTILLPVFLFACLYFMFVRTIFLYAPVFAFGALHLFAHYPSTQKTARYTRRIVQGIVCLSFVMLFIYINIMSIKYSFDWFGFGIGYPAPIEEAGFIDQYFDGSRIGNDYENGSYLSWKLWPEVKTLIDARYFPFQEWYDEYLKFINGVDVPAFLEKYRCDLWCLRIDAGVIPYFLNSPEWNLIFYGPSSAVFIGKDVHLPGIRKRTVADSITKTGNIRQAENAFYFAAGIKDFKTALDIIENTAVIQKRPQLKSRLYTILGNKHYNIKKREQASEFFLKALKEDPGNIDALFGMGICSILANDFSNAENYFRKALAINPDFEQAGKYLETILEHQKRTRALSAAELKRQY